MVDQLIPSPATRPQVAAVTPTVVLGVQGMMGLLVGVVAVTALYLAREVFVPVTLAVLLSFVLAPLVGRLRQLRLGRTFSVVLAVSVALGLILAIGGAIGSQVAQLAGDIPRYASTIERKVDAVRGYATGEFAALSNRLGGQFTDAAGIGAKRPDADASGRPTAPAVAQGPIPVEVHQPDPSPLETAQRILSPVLGPLATAGIVFIVSIFILLQQEDLRDRMIRLFGSGDLHRTTAAMDEAARRLSRYFLTQLALNAVFGVVIGAGLFFIGVPNPVLWGITSALFRFVPYIGAVLSGIFPLALAAAVDPGWTMMIATAGLFLVVEPVMGQVVEPLVYGHSTGLSPLSVVLSALFWTWLWGPIGLILSMPLTLCLVVLGRHVERLEFLDVLLGDRPALTPVESFYQRMLAGDPDEAEDHAELLLKERSLSSYYDEVALKGLQLAALDCARGVVGNDQLDRIRDSIEELIEALDGHDDREPGPPRGTPDPAGATKAERDTPKGLAPAGNIATADLPDAWRAPTPVLCLSGRGPLDEAASSMLAQLVRKHGIGARVASHEAASRSGIANTDLTGVAMVCISYLEITGTPSHLRYLLRRLRQRLPGVPILVGLWPADDAVLRDERLRAVIGADYYTTSLRDAVESVLHAAEAASQEETAAPEAA